MALAEKDYAEEARQQAKRQIELAERELANAKRIRQQAQTELEKAQAFKEHATKQLNEAILELTCHSCKLRFKHHQDNVNGFGNDNNNYNAIGSSSLDLSYISEALKDWEIRKRDHK